MGGQEGSCGSEAGAGEGRGIEAAGGSRRQAAAGGARQVAAGGRRLTLHGAQAVQLLLQLDAGPQGDAAQVAANGHAQLAGGVGGGGRLHREGAVMHSPQVRLHPHDDAVSVVFRWGGGSPAQG